MNAYAIGQIDTRPWGRYEVRDIGHLKDGREYCEKLITINPGALLSLQSHQYREETWHVLAGTLTGIIDYWRVTVETGCHISVPVKAIHTIANLGKVPLVIREVQTGLCAESDITRYCEPSGRILAQMRPPSLYFSMNLYKTLLDEIGRLPRF